MAASRRSAFASSYGSDSETELENVRENIIASQNILAAAIDSSMSGISSFRKGDVASAGGVLKFNDMSPAEFATFIDGTIYRDFADSSGFLAEQQNSSSSSSALIRHPNPRSSQQPENVSETRYTIPAAAPLPQTPMQAPPATAAAPENAGVPAPVVAGPCSRFGTPCGSLTDRPRSRGA